MDFLKIKLLKILWAQEYVYNHIRDQKTVGVITEDNQLGITEIAEPIGVIAGIVPVTNPTSTTIFKNINLFEKLVIQSSLVFILGVKKQHCNSEDFV